MHVPSPTIIPASAQFALDAFAAPAERLHECMASLYGLRGPESLRPWIEGQTVDVEELARRDYEPTAGTTWREEWEARLAEAFALLDGRLGADWPETYKATLRHDAMTLCRQNATPALA